MHSDKISEQSDQNSSLRRTESIENFLDMFNVIGKNVPYVESNTYMEDYGERSTSEEVYECSKDSTTSGLCDGMEDEYYGSLKESSKVPIRLEHYGECLAMELTELNISDHPT